MKCFSLIYKIWRRWRRWYFEVKLKPWYSRSCVPLWKFPADMSKARAILCVATQLQLLQNRLYNVLFVTALPPPKNLRCHPKFGDPPLTLIWKPQIFLLRNFSYLRMKVKTTLQIKIVRAIQNVCTGWSKSCAPPPQKNLEEFGWKRWLNIKI